MANVLYLSPEYVNLADVFDTDSSHLVKDEESESLQQNLVFTKILNNDSLMLYQETLLGLSFSGNQEYLRFQTASQVPVKGPFLERVSTTGGLDKTKYVNLLLIDKPPIRTGFFQFTVGSFSFTAAVVRQTEYEHYDWELLRAGSYGYVQKTDTLGYAIEISNNQLYNSDLSPKPLKTFLESLRGGEEITSISTTQDPNTYNQPVPGTITTSTINPILLTLSDADALRYTASYSDLITTLQTDVDAARAHYNQNGRAILFNPISYLNKYPDLRRTFEFDTLSATIHYIIAGYSEGRTYEGGDTTNNLQGALYDERFGNVPLADNTLIWQNGYTIEGKGKALTYRVNNNSQYISSAVDVTNTIEYMRVQ